MEVSLFVEGSSHFLSLKVGDNASTFSYIFGHLRRQLVQLLGHYTETGLSLEGTNF